MKSMNNWLLIVVLLYLIFSIGRGYRKGLVKMIVSVVALFIAILLSKMIAPKVENYLRQETTVYEQIQTKTEEYVEDLLEEKLRKGVFSVSDQAYAIEELPLPKYIRAALTKNNVDRVYQALGVNAFEDYVSGVLTEVTVRAIAFVIGFVVAWIGVFLVANLVEGVFKLPGLSWMNRMGGAAVGGIKAVIILWVLCLVVTAAAGTVIGQQILGMIRESQVLSAIYNHNYLMKWVSEVLLLQ